MAELSQSKLTQMCSNTLPLDEFKSGPSRQRLVSSLMKVVLLNNGRQAISYRLVKVTGISTYNDKQISPLLPQVSSFILASLLPCLNPMGQVYKLSDALDLIVKADIVASSQ